MTQPDPTAVLARIRQMADYWEQHLPEVIRTPAVVSAIRAALKPAVVPPADQAAFEADVDSQTGPKAASKDPTVLRDRIRRAVCEAEGFAWDSDMLEPDEYGEVADMVLAVLPPPVDRAACICGHTEQQHFEDVCITELTGCACGDFLPVEAAAEEIARLARGAGENRLALSQALGLGTGAPWSAIRERAAELRRLAAETQQPEPGPTIAALDGQETGTVFSPGEGVYGQDPYYVGVVAQQPECSASVSGSCLAEAQSETACDTDAGECVHGGRPGVVAQQPDTETHDDRPVPLATPCIACAHPFNWHNRQGCQFGNEANRCGCRVFAPGEKPAPVDPHVILGIDAPAVPVQPAAAGGLTPVGGAKGNPFDYHPEDEQQADEAQQQPDIEDPGAALARYIADQPISSIQAAFRTLGWPQLRFEVTEEQPAEAAAPVHLGDQANAELCPACNAERADLGYPWLCPAEPGAPATVPAAEEQPAETQASGVHPPKHTWTFEVCYDTDGDKWHGCGSAYDSSIFTNAHATALEDFRYRAENDKQRRRFRLVRATTTYTVEAEHAPPAERPVVGEQPDTQEADRIVAYRNPALTKLHCLRCTPHPAGDIWTPVTAGELEDGGICTVCGVDVLIEVKPS